MSESKDRLNFRMKPETAEKLEHWYKADHCRSKNEFVEKAVNFYADALAAENSTTLPLAIQTAIDGRLKMLEDRVASILYKQTVEMDMAISILLQSVNVDESVLRQERAKSIAAVKRTNGRLRMEQNFASWRMKNGKADRQEPLHQVRRRPKRQRLPELHCNP